MVVNYKKSSGVLRVLKTRRGCHFGFVKVRLGMLGTIAKDICFFDNDVWFLDLGQNLLLEVGVFYILLEI